MCSCDDTISLSSGAWAERSIFYSPAGDESDTIKFSLASPSPPDSPTHTLSSSHSSVSSLSSSINRSGSNQSLQGAWGKLSGAEALKKSLNVMPTPFKIANTSKTSTTSSSSESDLYHHHSNDPRSFHGDRERRKQRQYYGKQGSSDSVKGGDFTRSVSDNSAFTNRQRGRKKYGNVQSVPPPSSSEPAGGYSRVTNRTKHT